MNSAPDADWIAVDWGTSRLRVWHLDGDGQIKDQRASEMGQNRLKPEQFEPVLLDMVEDWIVDGATRAVACGMVGSAQGWSEVPYRSVPSRPDRLRPVPVSTKDRRLALSIVPGLCQHAPPDVMRGEETQVAGVLAQAPDFAGLICLPGTHTKWVVVEKGEVRAFRSVMTGEVFDLLCSRSVLRHVIDDGWQDVAFEAGVLDALARPSQVTAELFSVRASGLLCEPPVGAARARLSGLLVGMDVSAAKANWPGLDLTIVGAGAVSEPFARASAIAGWRSARRVDGVRATLDGLRMLAANDPVPAPAGTYLRDPA